MTPAQRKEGTPQTLDVLKTEIGLDQPQKRNSSKRRHREAVFSPES